SSLKLADEGLASSAAGLGLALSDSVPQFPHREMVSSRLICIVLLTAKVTWDVYGVDLLVRCDDAKTVASNDLTYDKRTSSRYELDESSRLRYLDFGSVVNKSCDGSVTFRPGDMVLMDFGRGGLSVVTSFQGVNITFTA
ncbi:hypothetical protein FOZ62_007543, partial [Perkinsus olseni]